MKKDLVFKFSKGLGSLLPFHLQLLSSSFWLPGATTSGADGILEVSPSQKLTRKKCSCQVPADFVDARHVLPPSGPWGAAAKKGPLVRNEDGPGLLRKFMKNKL